MNSGNRQQSNRSDRNQYSSIDEHDQTSDGQDRNREGRDHRSGGEHPDSSSTSQYGYQNQKSSNGYGNQERQGGQYRAQQSSTGGSYGQMGERDYSNQSTMPRQAGGRDQYGQGGGDSGNFDRDNTRGPSYGESSRGGYAGSSSSGSSSTGSGYSGSGNSGSGNSGSGQRGNGYSSGSSIGNRAGSTNGSGESTSGQHRGKGPKGYARTDTRIQEELSDRLMDDTELDASEVQVAIKSGEVTLTGSVPSKQCKFRAEEIAESCLGVTEVINQLRCQQGGKGQASKDSSKVDSSEHAASGTHSSSSTTNSGLNSGSSAGSSGTGGKSGSGSSSTR